MLVFSIKCMVKRTKIGVPYSPVCSFVHSWPTPQIGGGGTFCMPTPQNSRATYRQKNVVYHSYRCRRSLRWYVLNIRSVLGVFSYHPYTCRRSLRWYNLNLWSGFFLLWSWPQISRTKHRPWDHISKRGHVKVYKCQSFY